MKANNWLELIENNVEQIIETGINAYREALNNQHLRFIVEMNNEGEIYYWYDIAGGNSYHMSVHNGSAIELFQLCFQCSDLEITEYAIIEKLKDKGYSDRIEELMIEADEERTSIEFVIANNHKELLVIIEECRKEAIDFDISEYARDIIEQKLEYAKEMLECHID